MAFSAFPVTKELLSALESGNFQTALQLLPKDGPPITIGPEGVSPLHYACRHGEAEVTRLLITQYKYSINSTSKHGHTPAHVAAKYGHVETLTVLVESAALCEDRDVDAADISTSATSDITSVRDEERNTPLHTAAACGHFPVVQYLHRELGCSPTCTNQNKETPLHLAAENGHLNIVKYLVDEAGCPLSPVDEHGRTPVYVAAGHGQLEVVRYLIEGRGCDQNVRTNKRWKTNEFNIGPGRTLMHTTSREGHLDVVHYLVNELKCDPSCRDEDGVTPLHLASQQGHMEIVKFLVCECQCEPMFSMNNGNTSLHQGSTNGHLAVEQFLVEKGCDPLTRNKNGDTPVHKAAFNGRLNVLEFFITEKGCDPMVRGQLGRTVLHHASREGHLDTVKYLINEHQVDPSCQDEDSETPLHLASQNGHLAVVQFLVEKGRDPLNRNKYCNTPFHYAALNGRLNVLEFFITEKGCDPMFRGQWGRTLLHNASQEGHLATVKHLVNEHQVDPSCQDENGTTPLHLASQNGHLAVVQFLVEKGCGPLIRNKYYNTPVHQAAFCGRLNVLEFFITEKGCDPLLRGQLGRTLLHHASQEGHLDIVKYLINEHQVDPSCQDENGSTPLHLASEKGHLAVVQFLIEKGCDPLIRDKNGHAPVHYAAFYGRLDVLDFLITEKGCHPMLRGELGRTLLLYASQENGHLAVVHFLVEKGCNPLARNKHGNTPVHLAAFGGRLNVLEFFITEKGCDPMVRGRLNRTPLHMAGREGHLDIVKHLISKHQVDPSCQDEDGNTPLHQASQNGHLPVVQFLVEKGCDPLIKNKYYNTPVHQAAICGRLNVLGFLITEKGCDPMLRGQLGGTVLHHASQKGHLDTVKYLINEHQVDPSCQDGDGSTPMLLACRFFRTDVALYLYSIGEPLPKWYTTTKPLLDFRVKIYIVGNQSIGKSTMVKALCAESTWFGSFRNVSGVAADTAGIVPVEFESSLYGKVTFYDFAGHKEYYASHEIVFEASSLPVILLTVNVSEDNDSICKALRFWKQFLVSAISASGCQAHVIIVGSHADLVQPRDQAKQLQSLLLKSFEPSLTLTVIDSALLDCRKSSSEGISKLRQLLSTTCKKVRLQAEFDYQKGGILSEFISKSLPEELALTITELHSAVLNSPEPQLEPLQDFDILYQTCESLNISGHHLILRNKELPEESWIILKKELILSQVHGLLKHLKQSTQLSIVPLSLLVSQLRQHAPDLPPDLSIRYMKKMIFCLEVEPHALTLIKHFPAKSMNVDERYFFFSSLVSAGKPSHVWAPEQSFTYASGWHLKCANPDHFFTPRFLQVLLIELACRFALRPNRNSPVLLEPQQGCSIWKNGIRWLDPHGIEVMAQVEEDGKSLTLMLRCLYRSKMQCTQIRSELIWLILSVKRKVCKGIETKEYFIHPKCLDALSPPEHSLIPASDIVTALLHRDHNIVLNEALSTAQGSPFLSTEDLLYFEPYNGVGVNIFQALYDPQNQHKVVEQSTLEELAEALHSQWENIAVVLHTRQAVIMGLRDNASVNAVKKCMEIFTMWSAVEGTYSALHHDLGQYSIFRGRSLLDLCPEYLVKCQEQTSDMPASESRVQDPVHDSPTDRPSPPLTDNVPTDSDTGPLVELTDDHPLELDSLLEVMTEVEPVVAHSTDLGLAVGLRQENTLHVIQQENPQDIARQFTEIMAAWLRGVDQVAPPSWRTLTEALLSPTVDCPLVAMRIAEAHPSGSSCPSPERTTLASSERELQFQNVDASPLDNSSLQELVSPILERSPLWFHLGLVFGLSYGRLRVIQMDTPTTEQRLIKTVSSWLCLRDRVLVCGRPSWRTLVRSLAHPLVREMRLAGEIADRHKSSEEHIGVSQETPVHCSTPSHPLPSDSPAKST